MVFTHNFEIKIALLGNVSAGKTTVLNALFREKYGEVSMKRTTAGVNYFRVSRKPSPNAENEANRANSAPAETTGSPESAASTADWSIESGQTRSATSTVEEIAADNAQLRESDLVQEKAFDVELEENLVDMRTDTKLAVVDIPGINEAGASSKYKDYVSEKWQSFDCLVVVMDGRQGVSTQEQIVLLNFVATNLREKKDMPVIVLFNKVDDPEDEEQRELIREARKEVNSIVDTSKKCPFQFIPISAVHAFIFQSASLMTFEEFQKFDKDLIERIGRDQIGKKAWRKMSTKERFEAVFNLIRDPAENQEGFAETNFGQFLTALEDCCGGEKVQCGLIEKQLDLALETVNSGKASFIANDLESIHEKSRALDGDRLTVSDRFEATSLCKVFWRIYQKVADEAVVNFRDRPGNIDCLAPPMDQLIAYHGWIRKNSWHGEQALVVTRMKELIHRQLGVLFDLEILSCLSMWQHARAAEDDFISWEVLSPSDWEDIFSSFSLLSYDKYFCENFSSEKLYIDKLLRRASRLAMPLKAIAECDCGILTQLQCGECGWKGPSGARCNFCSHRSHYDAFSDYESCEQCSTLFKAVAAPQPLVGAKRKYENGKFVPVDSTVYMSFDHVHVPSSLSDPKHFGHLAWKYCQFMDSLE